MAAPLNMENKEAARVQPLFRESPPSLAVTEA